ncbi:MAG TPA: hypothetical protein VFI29_22385 [Hanamia sp.]|nr:hypothetical protein [Hanamia sp.]
MKESKKLKRGLGIFFLISLPLWALADNGKPVCNIKIIQSIIITMQADTLLPLPKNAEIPKDKPVETTIKEVPKARRQAVPIPVIVKVKPVKIIKPKIKIIKPVINVLH